VKLSNPIAAIDLVNDCEEFSRLPEATRAVVLRRIQWIKPISEAGWGARGKLTEKAAADLGIKPSTVRRHLTNFRREGWRGLIDGRAKPEVARGLPSAFREYVKQLYFQQQRETTGTEVWRQLVERWVAWRKTRDSKWMIPGYSEPPAPDVTTYPQGWSLANIRRLKPEKYQLATARQGAKAAANYLPSIVRTRAGVKFGQVVYFDDQDFDVKVAPVGVGMKVLRPQGFACMDYLSGAFLHHCTRLRWWDEELRKHRTLTQQDFTFFVVSYLQLHGYRNDDEGSHFLFEHGTATGYNNEKLSTWEGCRNFDDALASATGGRVAVHRSKLFSRPALASLLFRPASSGNPRTKSPLESMFNLVRGRMAALPGPTGRNRDLKPGEQYGQDLYVEQLLKLYDRLDEEHRKMIRWPVVTAQQFGEVTDALYAAINARTDHKIKDWEKCGFVAPEVRFTTDGSTPWLSQRQLADLPPAAQQAAMGFLEVPGHTRSVKLSPAQVAEQFRSELTKIPDSAVPRLIPKQWARKARVTDKREVVIKDQLIDSEPLVYIARFETRNGMEVLRPGTELICYLNPFLPERMVICGPDGSFLGTLFEKPKADWMDEAAVLEQLKVRASMKADLDTEVRPHLESLGRRRQAMKKHNDRLAAGLPVTPEEIAEDRSAAAKRGVSTRRAKDWQDGGKAAEAALQVEEDAPETIPDESIEQWLED
jgi:hypothetical protein